MSDEKIRREADRYYWASTKLRQLGWQGVGDWWWPPNAAPGFPAVSLKGAIEANRFALTKMAMTEAAALLGNRFADIWERMRTAAASPAFQQLAIYAEQMRDLDDDDPQPWTIGFGHQLMEEIDADEPLTTSLVELAGVPQAGGR